MRNRRYKPTIWHDTVFGVEAAKWLRLVFYIGIWLSVIGPAIMIGALLYG